MSRSTASKGSTKPRGSLSALSPLLEDSLRGVRSCGGGSGTLSLRSGEPCPLDPSGNGLPFPLDSPPEWAETDPSFLTTASRVRGGGMTSPWALMYRQGRDENSQLEQGAKPSHLRLFFCRSAGFAKSAMVQRQWSLRSNELKRRRTCSHSHDRPSTLSPTSSASCPWSSAPPCPRPRGRCSRPCRRGG